MLIKAKRCEYRLTKLKVSEVETNKVTSVCEYIGTEGSIWRAGSVHAHSMGNVNLRQLPRDAMCHNNSHFLIKLCDSVPLP